MSNAFNSADTIKKKDQSVEAEILFTEKKQNSNTYVLYQLITD